MSATRPRFSLVVYSYLTVFFLLLGFAPVYFIASVSQGIGAWLACFVWLAVIAGLTFYAHRRFSTDQMSFREGLLWVTASTMTGWMYFSFVVVLPSLLFVFFASAFIAIYGDLRRKPEYARAKWHRLVRYFYRNRMRQ
jgi:hypothetical protein